MQDRLVEPMKLNVHFWVSAAFACFLANAWGVPGPPPEGFLWQDRGLTFNPDNGSYAIPDLTGFVITDTAPAFGGPGAPTIGQTTVPLNRSFLTLPTSDAGTNAGDRFYEVATNVVGFNFAVGGTLSGDDGFVWVPLQDLQVDSSLSVDYGTGISLFTEPTVFFTGTFNQDIDHLTTVSTTGLLDGSAMSLDLEGTVHIRFDAGVSFVPNADASYDLGGTFSINQAYRTYELVAIPEPSTTMLVLLGSLSCFFRRRKVASL